MREGLPVVSLLGALFLAACGSLPEPQTPAPSQPLDVRLAEFAAASNRRDAAGLSALCVAEARLGAPSHPQGISPAKYAREAAADAFQMEIASTEILYANTLGAKTRSRARITAPARYALESPVETLWRFEEGQWKIAQMSFPDWPPLTGTWRKAGLPGEPSMELRILPGGTYVVHASRDRLLPAFKGSYRIAGNQISLQDSSAVESGMFSPAAGRYAVTVSGATADFRKIEDDNRWRSVRFEGAWTAER